MAEENGIINLCKSSGCGFKCCSFGSNGGTGYTIMLPNEYENANKSVAHLKVIDEDYHGGKKVQCTATKLFDCDGGYKPVQCRVYPIWVKDTESEAVQKSKKCPIQEGDLEEHKMMAMELVKGYAGTTPEKLNTFLSKVKVDRYKIFGEVDTAVQEIRVLEMKDLPRVKALDKMITDEGICYKSHEKVITESIESETSVGYFVDDILMAFSLCFLKGKDTAYIEKCFVLENFRGQGWQVEMLVQNLAVCELKGVKLYHTMASPENFSSVRSFEQVGFRKTKTILHGNHERVLLVHGNDKTEVNDFIDNAFDFVGSCKFAYIYGGKETLITSDFIERMAAKYPDEYTDEVINIAKTKIGKKGIDCSGLITLSLNMQNVNADALK